MGSRRTKVIIRAMRPIFAGLPLDDENPHSLIYLRPRI